MNFRNVYLNENGEVYLRYSQIKKDFKINSSLLRNWRKSNKINFEMLDSKDYVYLEKDIIKLIEGVKLYHEKRLKNL